MKDLKELALRVALTMPFYRHKGVLGDEIVEFSARLVAELQEDVEPIGKVKSAGFDYMKVELERHDNLPGIGDPVFLHPQPKAATVPGWKMVPVEPTDDMLWAGQDTIAIGEDPGATYRAMLSAAPSLPAVEVPPELDVRRIMLAVVPGEDGMGEEVYAKSVDDVVDCLTKLGQQVEDLLARPSLPAAEDARDGWLSYIDPECIEAQENALHTVSGFRAGQAFNELCRMLGGSWPDAKMQEEAPTAHKFFMDLFGCGQLAGTSFPNDRDDAKRLSYLIDYCCSDDWAEVGRIQSGEVARKRIDEWMARDEWYQRTAAPAMSQDKGEGK